MIGIASDLVFPLLKGIISRLDFRIAFPCVGRDHFHWRTSELALLAAFDPLRAILGVELSATRSTSPSFQRPFSVEFVQPTQPEDVIHA
jgi:hypothetical protein